MSSPMSAGSGQHSPACWGAARSRQRCCGRWSNCGRLPGWTGHTPSDGELRLFCAWSTFLGPSLPPLCFRGKECHSCVRLASAASYGISSAIQILEHAVHRFRRPGKTGRHAPERLVGMLWNGWTASIGIDGRHGPDYAPACREAGFHHGSFSCNRARQPKLAVCCFRVRALSFSELLSLSQVGAS